ncbi:MAG: sialate O-acetylesterase [Bryobacterales bacterium]|nr:sialate O-acetylesterase [Bryobacterales bacterium]
MGQTASRIRQGLIALAFAAVSPAEVRLPAILSDHMVLQSGVPVRLWGWASPGEQVTARLGAVSAKSKANGAGKWQLFLPPVAPGGPYTLTVNTQKISDVLAGDVWVASGQSNMAFMLQNADGAAAEIPKANLPRVRFFKIANTPADTPQEDVKGSWQSITPANAGQYSAVAYFFTKSLHLERKVPMAVIQTAWGGTNCQAWTRREVLTADANLKEYATRESKTPQNVASALWNGMVAPITPYPIKGFIWYQGEANRQLRDAGLYRNLFGAMIQDWRSQWGQGDLPFLWVLLAPFATPASADLPLTRESQLETLRLRNVGFANTLGVGNAKDIHPKNKKTVGERLANAARRVAYGSATAPISPVFRQLTAEGGKLRMWFDHAPAGLKLAGDAEFAFEIAGSDENYVPAEAKVEGATVLVSAESVPGPVFVRYAYRDIAPDALYSNAGVPAAPVRARITQP